MSWLLAFLGFAFLIIAHEAGHFTAAKAVGMRVERFFLFFPPKLWSFKRGETEYGVGAIPLGGFVKITGMNPEEELDPEVAPRAYCNMPVWKRIVVIGAGPLVNLVIAFLILFALGFGVGDPTGLAVGSVEPGTPAEGQLMQGDRIVSINGVARGTGSIDAQAGRLTGALEDLHCAPPRTNGCDATQTITVVVNRDGERKSIELRPFYDAQRDRFRVGFQFEGTDYVSLGYGPSQAAGWALDRMWFVTSETVDKITGIFNAEDRKQLSGIVGSYEVTRQSIEFDTRQALGVLALISLSLAVINLFPFLPLDGGHIFWAVVEKLRRGRPVSMRTMERASVIGIALVLVFAVIGFSNDIGRLTGEGFNVR